MQQIKRITARQAHQIIENREPLGLFYVCQEGEIYTAIDNSGGHAWIEDFDNVIDCIDYLLGEDVEEIRKRELNRKEVLQ